MATASRRPATAAPRSDTAPVGWGLGIASVAAYRIRASFGVSRPSTSKEATITDLLTDGRRKYFTAKEVADYLGLSRSTVYQFIDRGDIGASKFGSSLRILRQEILRYENASAYRPSVF